MIVISGGCSRITDVVHISDENLVTRISVVTNVSLQLSLIWYYDLVIGKLTWFTLAITVKQNCGLLLVSHWHT